MENMMSQWWHKSPEHNQPQFFFSDVSEVNSSHRERIWPRNLLANGHCGGGQEVCKGDESLEDEEHQIEPIESKH
ncbi:hypothetical protein KIN20_008697 [Parelaphostrongylus tenuis]|uniref:Uncharacterized protein n=1 Tax=Parelaphostrongylus tenuis TaxID=148309 RepID=A0AAD5M8B4_PARTN|nr:hypothetical protein KIN20_008697 [Parelaphostrongylus tenuis]